VILAQPVLRAHKVLKVTQVLLEQQVLKVLLVKTVLLDLKVHKDLLVKTVLLVQQVL
jgi:hypothetical protein